MAENDAELTYEDISGIRRTEENSTFLSQIRADFYDAARLLIRKNMDARNKILMENPDMYDGISSRYRNVSTMLERIISIRANKIWLSALRDAAAGTPTAPDNLAAGEKDLYMALYDSAKRQFSAVNGSKTAFTQSIDAIARKEEPAEAPAEEQVTEAAPMTLPEEGPAADEMQKGEVAFEAPAVPPMEDIVPDEEEVVIRVLDDVPTFSGPERDYTLMKEDVVRLPSMMASALVNRQKAVLVRTAP